jgi:hypothetical protein
MKTIVKGKPTSKHPWKRQAYVAASAAKASKEHADRDEHARLRVIHYRDMMGVRA